MLLKNWSMSGLGVKMQAGEGMRSLCRLLLAGHTEETLRLSGVPSMTWTMSADYYCQLTQIIPGTLALEFFLRIFFFFKQKPDSKCLKLGKNSASNVSFLPLYGFFWKLCLKYHVLSMSYLLWTKATGFWPWMAFRGRDRTKQQNTLCFFSTAQIFIMLGSGLSSKCCSFGSEEFLFLRWYEKS